MRFHHGVAAVAVAHGVVQVFHGQQVAGGFDVGHDLRAAVFLLQTGVGAGLGLHDAVFVDDLQEFQIVLLAQGPVVVVVAGGHLEGAGTELAIHVAVGDDGDLAAQHGHDGRLAHQMLVALVLGMHADGGVAGDGLGTGGGDGDAAGAVGQMVTDLPQLALVGLVFHFVIGQGRMAARAPVDDVVALVDQAFVVELHEDLAHGGGQAFVHGEAQARPVHGSAQGADLVEDAVTVVFAPLPHALDEGFAAQVLTGLAFLGQSALHHVLGGDAGVVGAGHPQHVLALLAGMTAQHVDEGLVQGMPDVQGAGNVRRRDHDGNGHPGRA